MRYKVESEAPLFVRLRTDDLNYKQCRVWRFSWTSVRIHFRFLFAYGKWNGRRLGKPFESEMGVLAATYKWSKTIDLGVLADFAERCRWKGLFVVGSGGSFSVATYA